MFFSLKHYILPLISFLLRSHDGNGANVLRSWSNNKITFEKFFKKVKKKTPFLRVSDHWVNITWDG